ncbi:MAG: hypothetical protein EPN31_15590 [Castellaniella sp.]|uniref:hypothetical protein n=1 Tax=Castellaniella sp. TaxID=1955812 RepID=UPI0012118592|nr:hypothetical protein [Castellaniella sp.]TAN25330.1 MAG: hypothetical protein EPN31_15590 [Castellaniella sp.]
MKTIFWLLGLTLAGVLGLVIMLVSGCFYQYLELDHASSLKTTCSYNQIKLTGWTGDSALFITGTKIKTEKDYVLVLVKESLFTLKKKTSGFKITIDINDKIRDVRFGKKEVVVWSKVDGCKGNKI